MRNKYIKAVLMILILFLLFFIAYETKTIVLDEWGKTSIVEIDTPEKIKNITISEVEFEENVTNLDLSKLPLDDNLNEKIGLFINLQEVDLSDVEIKQEDKIELVRNYPDVFFKFKVKINGMEVDSDIKELDLKDKKISDYEEFSNSLILLQKLESIDLGKTNLTDEQAGKLREEYPNVKIDWVIYLGKAKRWSLRTDAVAFSVLIYRFDYKRLESKDIEVLKYCTNLKALDLGHQAITDISVIGDYLQDLRVLILADNQISDLTPISKLKHLHYLELFMNKITDLSPLAECTEMIDLNVCHNYKLSDVTPILNYEKIERLWISTCKVSQDDYKLLKKTYPNTKIVTKDPWSSTSDGWRTHPRYYAMIDMYHKNYYSDEFGKYDK